MYEIYVSKINRNLITSRERKLDHMFDTLEEAMEEIRKIVDRIKEEENVDQISQWDNAVEISFDDKLHTQITFEVIDA